jgi:hypothetical protein
MLNQLNTEIILPFHHDYGSTDICWDLAACSVS